jgi:D-amino-acid oxidase
MPFHCEDPRVDRWAIETLDELYPMAKDESNPGVELVPCVGLKQKNTGPTTDDMVADNYSKGTGGKSSLPAWTTDARLEFQHMACEMLYWQNTVLGLKIPSQETMMASNYKHAWCWNSPIVDSPYMLTSMLDEVKAHEHTIDVNVETGHKYASIGEMVDVAKAMDCDGVVNCTGLGAKELCGDSKLVGARGILLHFDRATTMRTYKGPSDTPLTRDTAIFAEDGPWGTETEPCYLIPRGNTLVVGGSYLEGDGREGMTAKERERLLENATLLGIDVKASPPVGEWTGFRPARPITKCEIDASITDVKLVHSYGHGGSGWTVNVGVAKETADLLTS